MISIVVGTKASVNRFGIRKFTIENDFIYDTMTQALLGTTLIERSQDKPIRVSGLKIMALWNLQLFDRIRIIDQELKLDGEFYVTNFNTDWRSQTTTLQVRKVADQ